jgi:hypothetical protein
MERSTRTGLFALLAVLALVLSGCDFNDEFFPFRAGHGANSSGAPGEATGAAVAFLVGFTDAEGFESGSFTPTGPTTADVHDKTVTGPFKATLPFPVIIPNGRVSRPQGVKTRVLKGTFIADLNGSTDSSTGTAQMTGLGVLKYKIKGLGFACFQMSGTFSQHGTKGSGSFSSLGGTKASARTRVRGTFKDTVTPTTAGSTDKGKLRGMAKFRRPPKAPPAACKTLAAKLPG